MKKIKLFLIALITLLASPLITSAASGTISVSGPSTVVQGNKVTVTVTLSSGTAIGSWQMDLNYDKSFLQLVSSSAEAKGTMMADSSAGGTKSKTYTFAFKALKTGTTRVSVGSYLAYAYNDFSSMSLTSSSKSIKIMTQQELEATYSKDNNLKDLSVEGYELDKAFDKDTLEYSVNLPTGTTSINILASENDRTASISGAGTVQVTEGTNTILIVVTAQNGDQKTYTLTVNVEDQNPINVKIANESYVVVKNASLLEAPITFTETTVKINDFDVPAFENDAASITLVGLKKENGDIILAIYDDGKYSVYNEMHLNNYLLIPVPFESELGLIKTTVSINDEKFDAYKYSEDTEFVIINAKSLENGKNSLYLYDPVNKTAIRYDETFIKNTSGTIKNYTYIIIAFASALLLMLIIIFCLLHSLKKKQRKINKFVQKQEAKIEATRKLNDVVEEVKKITEAEKVEKEEEKTSSIIEMEEKAKAENDLSLTQMITGISEELESELKEENKKKDKKFKKKKHEETKEDSEIEIKEIQKVELDPNNEIKRILDDNEEVYDLFGDDKKKKKKKKD